jgi:FG-GAP-like repeat
MRGFKSGLVLCLLTAATSLGEEKFAAEIRIQAGAAPIDVGGFRGAAPFVGDFDRDGLNDLLVGEESGRLRIYRNVGTKQEPRFDDFEWFRVNGEIAELPGGGLFRPQVADLDGDGELDLVTASWSGMVLWYRRTGRGEFVEAEIVRLATGQVLNAGTNAGCHVVDWDGDGDNDLIISGQTKPDAPAVEVWFVENKGSPLSLSLAAPRPLKVDGEAIRASQREVFPFVADWNGDGKWDLLLGMADGSVVLHENSGERRAPKLAAARLLVEPVRRGRQPADAEVVNRGIRGSICVTDWDRDGTLDILMGDTQSETVRSEAPESMADQLEKMRRETTNVLSEYRRLRALNNRLQERQEKQRGIVRQRREQYARRLEELHEEISKLETSMQPQRKSHGYVWLLRRTSLR